MSALDLIVSTLRAATDPDASQDAGYFSLKAHALDAIADESEQEGDQETAGKARRLAQVARERASALAA